MTSTVHKNKNGDVEWRNEKGQRHRENGPATEWVSGKKEWYVNGQRHRESGPAVELADGSKYWYLNGQRHRENGPAHKWDDGPTCWYLHGQLHRENGPAIEYPDGRMRYYLHGQTGPEIEQQVKENVIRIQAKKEQQEMLSALSQDDEVSAKINIYSLTKIHKKL